MPVNSAALQEVSAFVDARRGDYRQLLDAVQRELVQFKDRIEYRDAIYRIYSRADKQVGGDPLKSKEKIAEKLSRWREETPAAKPQDIHDIIGITVVVYFESQRDRVADALLQKDALPGLNIFDRDLKKEDGYYAVHMKVSGKAPAFWGLKGEVQVKTLLHDGWAAKTHDLTYKPQIELSKDINVHMEILGDAVQLVEQQSDIIRGLIDRAINREKKRRRAAQERFMFFMTEPSAPEYDPRAAELAQNMANDLEQLRLCRQTDPCLTQHFEAWKSYVADNGVGRPACRLITFLASVREAQDLTNIALGTIDEWIALSKDPVGKQGSLIFRSVANYLFGNFEKAAAEAADALSYSKNNSLNLQIAAGNRAYMLTEYYLQKQHKLDKHQLSEIRDELQDLVRQIEVMANDASSIDTRGMVAIALGATEEEIRAGLKLCQLALEMIPETEPVFKVRKAYYVLHEQRAFQRLLDFGEN